MDRLLCSFSICVLTVTALTGQVIAQPLHSHYSITGDVAAPQTYAWSRDSSIHVLDLLAKAGAETPVGVAVVLRGSSMEQVAVDHVQPGMTGRGALLAAGDVVVFRDTAVPGKYASNALVLLNGTPDVLLFGSSGLSVEGLLNHLRKPLTQSLRVTRVDRGRSSTVELSTKDRIQRGDIVHVEASRDIISILPPQMADSVATTDDTNRFGFPEQSSKAAELEAEPSDFRASGLMLTIPGGDSASPATGNAAPADDHQPAGFDVPFGQTTNLRVETTPERDEYASGVETGIQMELLPQTVDTDVDHDVSAVSVQSVHPDKIHSASLQNTVEAATDDAPKVSAAGQNDAGFALWNLVFVGGLLMAAGLVVVGWLKTRQEREMDSRMNQSMRENMTAAPVSKVVPSETSEDSDAAYVADDDCPVLSAGLEDRTSVVAGIDDMMRDHVEAQVTEPVVETAKGTTIVADEWFAEAIQGSSKSDEAVVGDVGDSLLNSEAAEDPKIEEPLMASEPVSDLVDSEIAAVESDAVPELKESWSDLEDLIQNRLPVELTELQLPLRVSLFGKPAGPRRLRIDAAHTEIAAPHMIKKERRSRRREPVAADQSASPVPPKASADGDTAAESSRLDNALNFLEEQSGS